jgi:hypothetical protein
VGSNNKVQSTNTTKQAHVRFIFRKGTVTFTLKHDANRFVVNQIGPHTVGFADNNLTARFIAHTAFTCRDNRFDFAVGEGDIARLAIGDGSTGHGRVTGFNDQVGYAPHRVPFRVVQTRVLEKF